MHLSKAQFTKRILNAQGMLEKVEENIYYLNEPEKGEKLYRIGYTPKVTFFVSHLCADAEKISYFCADKLTHHYA